MPALVYAPEVTIHIRTAKNSRGKGRVINVSEDTTTGSVTRVTGGVSSAQFTLLNQSRKYDGMFSPMDTITIRMRRIGKTVLKFSGYLDSVPLWAAAPGSIQLSASCSIKRLVQFYWDPTSAAAFTLLNKNDPNYVKMSDGGMSQRAINLMTEVAEWPKAQIHIARIPENWYDKISKVADKLVAESEALSMASEIGSGAWIKGLNPLTLKHVHVEGIGPGTGTLPDHLGRISHFGGPGGGAPGQMALTGESGVRPRDPWYCAMRWPYVNENLIAVKGVDVQAAKAWWRNRKILVVNPKTNKAVVLRAADWGPNVRTGRIIDVSPRALSALGASTDDNVRVAFAPEDAGLGPVSVTDAGLGAAISSRPGGVGSYGGARGKIDEGWGQPGDERNIVTAHAAGLTFQVHRMAKINFEGFVNDLVNDLGYRPKVIGGYNDRDIDGTSKKSNHAWGAAIDIDPPSPINVFKPGTNPRYPTGAGGRYALPKPPAIIKLARKWGLGWGGEWHNSKDYMHFEVIGAPSSDTYDGVSGSGVGVVYVRKWKPPIHGKYQITTRFGVKGSHWASGYHTGTDFAVPIGTKIYPVGPGTVHDKGAGDSSYGNWISIDHGGGYYTFYAHMNAPSPAAVGDPVTTNTLIGRSGDTGNVTGPHLHLELRKGADTYGSAISIEKYVLGGKNRSDPPKGTQAMEGDAVSAGTEGLDLGQIGRGLFNVWQWDMAQPSQEGILLGGFRAVMNDQPIINTIDGFMKASMRQWCSAPNGDFIAWFPDYFGHFKQAGKMVVSPLEIAATDGPPTIGWSDTHLRTHQFVSSATMHSAGDASSVFRTATTAGIASVEFPELMMALFNISRKEAEQMRDEYLYRYGARPNRAAMNEISGSRAEFFFACMMFMENWTQQFQTRVSLTFMPELYPGMLLCLPSYGMQGYIRETTDSWDMRDKGGFTTEVSCAPWSSIGRNDLAPATLPVGAPL